MNSSDLFNTFFSSSFLGKNFTTEENRLCSLIFRQASEEVQSVYDGHQFQYIESAGFENQIEATRKNLVEILRLFKKAATSRKKFLKHFPDWGKKRGKNISKLRELASAINKDRLNCNISKITGSSVSLIGGAVFVSSLAFPPTAAFLAIGGGVAALTGGSVTFLTSVVETILLRNYMKQANLVLEADKKDFAHMSLWFKHSQDLIDAIEKIMGYSVLNEIWNDFKNSVHDLKTLIDGKVSPKLQLFIKMCVKIMRISNAPFAVACELIPIVITFFVMIVLLNRNNCLVLSSLIITHRIVFGIMKIFDLTGDIGIMIYSLLRGATAAGTEAVSKAAARVIAHGVFSGIGIALDATNIVLSSIDIHKGSVSKHAEEIIYVANKLEEEYEVLDTVYKQVGTSDIH